VKTYWTFNPDGTDTPKLDDATSSVILYKDQDGTTSRRVNGYKTAFQYAINVTVLYFFYCHFMYWIVCSADFFFLNLKLRYFEFRHRQDIGKDDPILKNAGLHFAVGHFSYAELPNSFGLILVRFVY
jgi:hypothetical protein